MFDQVKDLCLGGPIAHIERGFSEAEFVAAFGILGVKAATQCHVHTPEDPGGEVLFPCR